MPLYRALSIKQPWANLIRGGHKTIETRGWRTSYRGDLLLCASATPRIAPFGCTICLAELVDCRPMRADEWDAAGIAAYGGDIVSPFARGRTSPPRTIYGWHLAHIRPLPPIPVRGRLHMFTVELPDVLSRQ
jgi:ASCH domain